MTRRVAAGCAAVLSLVAALAISGFWRGSASAQAPSPEGPFGRVAVGENLLALSSDVHQSHQQLTIVDPTARVMSVYHIDRASGVVTLKSVRNIHWDLQMEEFNGVSPSPREIRSLLKSR